MADGSGEATGAVEVREVADGDLDRWATLFRAYRAFYRLVPDEDVVRRVWGWLHDEGTAVRGLVAERDGRVVGIAHHRRFLRPSSGTAGLYLDDLFVDPAARGSGVGRALLDAVGALAGAEGCSAVRWITAPDNAAARRLYDRTASATPWVTYDLTPVTPAASEPTD